MKDLKSFIVNEEKLTFPYYSGYYVSPTSSQKALTIQLVNITIGDTTKRTRFSNFDDCKNAVLESIELHKTHKMDHNQPIIIEHLSNDNCNIIWTMLDDKEVLIKKK